MTIYDEAIETLRTSGIDRIIDAAFMDGRLTYSIDAATWDRIMPAARLLCGTAWREMYAPWRAFMYGGKWIERAK